jgi:RNA polymerase sigma-70 factor (ECF subfamily)
MPTTSPAIRPARTTVGDAALDDDDGVAEFGSLRPRLFGIAYRIVGRRSEAEDIVQDAWLRWQTCDRSAIVNPTAFLVTVTTRLAITVAQSARIRRESYDRRRQPEPVDRHGDPAAGAERNEALELGILALLQRLSPIERAAYVLRQAFDYPYAQIAEVLHTTETNARQRVSRATRNLATDRQRSVSRTDYKRLLHAFTIAAQGGGIAALEHVLTIDIVGRAAG